MQSENIAHGTGLGKTLTSSYREVKVKGTLYCVTNIFTGEKELGSTLEKLAVQHILDAMDDKEKQLLHS